jgi:cytochrome c peroxidase
MRHPFFPPAVLVIIAAILICARAAGTASAAHDFVITPPIGISADVWSYFSPRDNPLTPAKVELGRQLFFDQRLSFDNSVSCATCHDPRFAFADGKKTAMGIGGRRGARNTPTILNAMFNSTLFWDGRAESLESQTHEPLINPDEMGNTSHEQVVKRLAAIPEYAAQFQKVFGGPVDIDSLGKAIAAFERTLVSANAPFDRFLAGDRNALNEAAQRGFTLFRSKARCSVCHNLNNSFPFFTDGNYRNTGVAANFSDFGALFRQATALSLEDSNTSLSILDKRQGRPELGRFLVTRNALDIGSFRTPMLRNVELTAPYFHDGSAATLADVVRYYVRGGNENASRDWELQAVGLSELEQQDLIEFLKSLTSDDARAAALKRDTEKGRHGDTGIFRVTSFSSP